MVTDDENLAAIDQWCQDCGVDTTNLKFHIIPGSLMNAVYGLTGSNRYPNDLTIVSLTGIDIMPLVMPRFEVGGRWFDDIVDNNSYRETHKY